MQKEYTGCALFYLLSTSKKLFKFFRLNLMLNLNFPKSCSLGWLQVVLQNILNHRIMKLCRRPKQTTEVWVLRSLRCSLGHLGQTTNPQQYALTVWMSESCWSLLKGLLSKGAWKCLAETVPARLLKKLSFAVRASRSTNQPGKRAELSDCLFEVTEAYSPPVPAA